MLLFKKKYFLLIEEDCLSHKLATVMMLSTVVPKDSVFQLKTLCFQYDIDNTKIQSDCLFKVIFILSLINSVDPS